MKLQYPSMVINGVGVAIKFKGSPQTWNMNDDFPLIHVIDWVANIANGLPSGLRCLFINAHGSNAYISLGKNAKLKREDLNLLSKWNGKIDSIIFRVCHLASPQPTQKTADMNFDPTDSTKFDGDSYCRKVTEVTSAVVFASTDYQTACDGKEYDVNEVDEWEGTVFTYRKNKGLVSREANHHSHVDTCMPWDVPGYIKQHSEAAGN